MRTAEEVLLEKFQFVLSRVTEANEWGDWELVEGEFQLLVDTALQALSEAAGGYPIVIDWDGKVGQLDAVKIPYRPITDEEQTK